MPAVPLALPLNNFRLRPVDVFRAVPTILPKPESIFLSLSTPPPNRLAIVKDALPWRIHSMIVENLSSHTVFEGIIEEPIELTLENPSVVLALQLLSLAPVQEAREDEVRSYFKLAHLSEYLPLPV